MKLIKVIRVEFTVFGERRYAYTNCVKLSITDIEESVRLIIWETAMVHKISRVNIKASTFDRFHLEAGKFGVMVI